jgi:hypothetical protein
MVNTCSDSPSFFTCCFLGSVSCWQGSSFPSHQEWSAECCPEDLRALMQVDAFMEGRWHDVLHSHSVANVTCSVEEMIQLSQTVRRVLSDFHGSETSPSESLSVIGSCPELSLIVQLFEAHRLVEKFVPDKWTDNPEVLLALGKFYTLKTHIHDFSLGNADTFRDLESRLWLRFGEKLRKGLGERDLCRCVSSPNHDLMYDHWISLVSRVLEVEIGSWRWKNQVWNKGNGLAALGGYCSTTKATDFSLIVMYE